jgi:hypothetical protein
MSTTFGGIMTVHVLTKIVSSEVIILKLQIKTGGRRTHALFVLAWR